MQKWVIESPYGVEWTGEAANEIHALDLWIEEDDKGFALYSEIMLDPDLSDEERAVAYRHSDGFVYAVMTNYEVQVRPLVRLAEIMDVQQVVFDAEQAAFRVIADAYKEAGYPVTGDISPPEASQLNRDFTKYVKLMAPNAKIPIEVEE